MNCSHQKRKAHDTTIHELPVIVSLVQLFKHTHDQCQAAKHLWTINASGRRPLQTKTNPFAWPRFKLLLKHANVCSLQMAGPMLHKYVCYFLDHYKWNTTRRIPDTITIDDVPQVPFHMTSGQKCNS